MELISSYIHTRTRTLTEGQRQTQVFIGINISDVSFWHTYVSDFLCFIRIKWAKWARKLCSTNNAIVCEMAYFWFHLFHFWEMMSEKFTLTQLIYFNVEVRVRVWEATFFKTSELNYVECSHAPAYVLNHTYRDAICAMQRIENNIHHDCPPMRAKFQFAVLLPSCMP